MIDRPLEYTGSHILVCVTGCLWLVVHVHEVRIKLLLLCCMLVDMLSLHPRPVQAESGGVGPLNEPVLTERWTTLDISGIEA
jgi:hypothetical protein